MFSAVAVGGVLIKFRAAKTGDDLEKWAHYLSALVIHLFLFANLRGIFAMSKVNSKWLSDRDVAERYSVSRATVWRWSRSQTIPQPKQLGENTTRWSCIELDQHDQKQFNIRGA